MYHSGASRRDHSLVMPGLDPGIHQSSQDAYSKGMDCRVKAGNDGLTWLFEIRIRRTPSVVITRESG
jgi:hypothetical protein